MVDYILGPGVSNFVLLCSHRCTKIIHQNLK